MAKAAETPPDTLLDKDTALRLFRMMALIRRFEERTEEQYTRARIGGYCHLAIGEEASTVGAIDALEPGDCLYASYRDHGTALAVGSEPAAVMAVREATARLMGIARRERRPALLETITYRFRGHSVADAGKVYRSAEEIDSWRKRDPITRFGLLCSERGLLERDEIDQVWSDVAAEVKSAIDEALGAAFPVPDTFYVNV